jgi:hypothetical protein
MSNLSDTFRSLLSRLGVAGPARLRAFKGSGAPAIACGSGASKITSRIVLVLAATLAAVTLVTSPAGAAQTRRELGTFGGASSSVVDPYPLSNSLGVAVDQETEDVYVADAGNHRVEKFSAAGQFLLAFGGSVGGLGTDVCGGLVACAPGSEGSAPGEFTTPQFVAVDNDPTSPSFHDVYVADTADNLVSKFTEEGVLIVTWGAGGQLSGGCEKPSEAAPCSGSKVVPFGSITGIAVGSTGTLYVLTQAGTFSGDLFEFEPSSQSLSTLTSFTERSQAVGFGVSSTGNFFLNEYNSVIGEYGPTGGIIGHATLSSSNPVTALTVDSNGELYFASTSGTLRHDAFNGAGEVLEPGGGTCAPIPAKETGCGVSDSVQAGFAGSGIAVATGSGDTLLSNAGAGTVYRYGPLRTAIPPEEPRSEQAVEVTAASAKLEGVLDTNAEGEPGAYEFLYRQSASECEGGKATPPAPAGGKRGEMVSAVAGELLPGTVYTFCLRASNGAGETALGAPVSFTTGVAVPVAEGLSVGDVAATSATLEASVDPGGGVASCVFEYAPVGGVFAPVPGADAAGIVAEGDQSVPVSFHAQSLQAGTVYEFRVSVTNSAGSFVSESVSFTTQSARGVFALPDGREWEMVSPPDKLGALIYPLSTESRLAQASVDGDAMTYLASTPTESESQGFAEKEQVFSARGPDGWVSRDITPPHEHPATIAFGYGEEYVDFSEDLSLAVVQPHGPFEPSLSPEASEQTAYLHTIFLNGNVNDPCVESCYRPLVTAKPGYANVPPGTVFGEGCAPGHIVHNLCGPVFTGATPDLSHIAFRSAEPLLPGSGRNEEYEWVDGKLSVGNHLPGQPGGSWGYSISGRSVYVSHGGVTKLVAAGLSLEDELHDSAGASVGDTSRVSPDGRWFAFMSSGELTGYNNHDAVSGQPDEEVYLYHAPEDLTTEAGTLVCASCNPTGAGPVGVEYDKLMSDERDLVLAGDEWREDPWIAANVPGWEEYAPGKATHQPRYLSDSGRLFFNSSDALVPKDVNGNEDVYEFEPVGVGSCTTIASTGSSTYVPDDGGCVSLISSGQNARESAFLDASENGGDVFFLTAARLAPQDYDSALDVYDAHECTSAAPCSPASEVLPPPCDTGDSCKPAPMPQPAIFGAPATATFSGPGNMAPTTALTSKRVAKRAAKCRREFVKNRKNQCVKRKPKKNAKKASNDRRAGR